MAEKARTEAAATSAPASATAVKDDRVILITVCKDIVGVSSDLWSMPQAGGIAASKSSSRDAGCFDALADRHAGVEARKPMDDCVSSDGRVSELAMLLRSLPCREYPRRHGAGADELAHG